MENSDIVIRPYKESDRESLRSILKTEASYTQKHHGRGSANKKECLCYMYSDYYFDYEPSNVLVAEDNGEVCGFIAVSTDTQLFQKRMKDTYIPKIWEKSKVWAIFHRICISVNKKQDYKKGVSFHINIDKGHQGKKIGTKLMTAMAELVLKKGKQFLYLVTENTRTAGYAFYSRLGFQVIKHYPCGPLMMVKDASALSIAAI